MATSGRGGSKSRLDHLGAAILLAVCLAGCADAGPTKAAAVDSQAPIEPGADFSITGLVNDDELKPVEAASIRLAPGDRTTHSDAVGEFAFPAVAAGTYELQVEKAGFKTRRQRIEVRAGVDAPHLTIQLDTVPISRARVQTLSLKGFIACSVSYTKLTAFPGEYSVCRNVQQSMDKSFLDFGLEEGARGMLVETVWSGSTPAAKALKVRIQKGPGGGAFTDGAMLGEARGPSVLRLEVPWAKFLEAAAAGTDCARGCNLTSMAASSPSFGTPVDAGLALQEPYEQWLSIYYWQDLPPGASAMPDGGKGLR
jgi:hypothetical protein